jgi:mRNA interferase RelE/StbE
MASYKIEWKRSAIKELEKLPRQALGRVVGAVNDLALEPFPNGFRKLVGAEQTYRIRVGDYRVLYSIYQKQLIVEIIRVKHRKDVYRR